MLRKLDGIAQNKSKPSFYGSLKGRQENFNESHEKEILLNLGTGPVKYLRVIFV